MLKIVGDAPALKRGVKLVWLLRTSPATLGDAFNKCSGGNKVPTLTVYSYEKRIVYPVSRTDTGVFMNNKKLHFAGVGLLIAPFFAAGWFIASWLSSPNTQDRTRAEIIVINPPSQFDLIAQDLGFGITHAPNTKNMNRFAYNIRAPKGLTAESALQLLEDEFPGIVLNAKYQRAP